jgi:hypothetical protein
MLCSRPSSPTVASIAMTAINEIAPMQQYNDVATHDDLIESIMMRRRLFFMEIDRQPEPAILWVPPHIAALRREILSGNARRLD